MEIVISIIITILIAFIPAILIAVLIIRAICNYLAKRIAIEIKKNNQELARMIAIESINIQRQQQ